MKLFSQLLIALVVGLEFLSMPALADDANLKAAMNKDKTGINPVKFTHVLRLYNQPL